MKDASVDSGSGAPSAGPRSVGSSLLLGWRHVRVSERRTRRDYAHSMQELVDVHYPQAQKIRLVQDNLNTHDGASLYETFPAAEARGLLDKIEFHYTRKHAVG